MLCVLYFFMFFFFFNDTATTEIYTLSLHDALPILSRADHGNAGGNDGSWRVDRHRPAGRGGLYADLRARAPPVVEDVGRAHAILVARTAPLLPVAGNDFRMDVLSHCRRGD